MFGRSCLWALIVLLHSSPMWADQLKTLTGKSINGAVIKVSDKDITLKTSEGDAVTPLAQVLDVLVHTALPAPSAEKYAEIELLDDSILRCTRVTFGAKEIDLELTTGAQVKVPLTSFVTMLRDAQDPEIKKQWSLAKAKSRSDRIFVLSGGDLNTLEGLLGEVNQKEGTIQFKNKGADSFVGIKLERLQGISYARTELPPEGNLCRVIDIDGNTLVASKLGYDGKQWTIGTSFGARVTLEPKVIARLDFNFGRLTYLSDLEGKVSDAPLLGGFSPLRKDANLDGNHPIMILEKQYAKGLSMYAGVEVDYNLAGKYKQFKATLGADPRIAEEGQGKVTVSIYCDQEKRFSELVSMKAARTIALDVKDVGTLRIVVTGTNFTNYSGHATLGNAYVSQ